MRTDVDAAAPVVRDLVDTRTRAVVAALGDLSETELLAPSALPGWSRLTIACHLRYGAEALLRITEESRAGRAVAYYPEGRREQRPLTLVPRGGEAPHGVVHALAAGSAGLSGRWADLADEDWSSAVEEPPGNADLGATTLGRLALGRLTELEVHGTDLDVGLPDWDPAFVDLALGHRIAWLEQRRSNHRAFDEEAQGSWCLRADDGPTFVITVAGRRVESRRVAPGAAAADATVAGSSRDLLALLLGRPTSGTLRLGGDQGLASRFGAAFPGP